MKHAFLRDLVESQDMDLVVELGLGSHERISLVLVFLGSDTIELVFDPVQEHLVLELQ